eukprot:RCo008069
MAVPEPMKKFSFLVGRWAGSCTGILHGSEFGYDEEIQVEALPSKPIFTYSQETWSRPGGNPMHRETGYFRVNPKRESGLDLLVVQGSGITEVEEGALVKPGCVELKTTAIARTSAARKPFVHSIRRVFTGDAGAGVLSYKVYMATDNSPEEFLHLKCDMRRK